MHALGRHVILELYECDAEVLKDLGKVRDEMMEAARRAQTTIVTTIFHEFSPSGISGVVVISASHLSIHTWPENRYAAVDIFWCGAEVQPQAAIDHLALMFGAERIAVVELKRGVLVENHVEMKLGSLPGHLLQPLPP
jgi:S-adenosylmethionine decarboxylase proenzyme